MSFKSIFLIMMLATGFDARSAQAQVISNVIAISFGEMVVGGIGDVTIPSNLDSRSATGAVALVGLALVERGRVDVTYTPGAQVIISVPSSLVMTGANTPTLTPTIDGGTIQTIPPGGILTIHFGGTINFPTFGATGLASVVVPVTVDPL